MCENKYYIDKVNIFFICKLKDARTYLAGMLNHYNNSVTKDYFILTKHL